MADFVSVCVVTLSQTIVPWSVVTANPSHKFSDLFQLLKAGLHPSVQTSQELSEVIIESVAVGPERQSLSIVSETMNVLEVCRMFGHFVKFRVSKQTVSTGEQTSDPVKNAFEVMMASQLQLCRPKLPEKITEKNRKDKLYNDLICLLDGKGLKWSDGEVSSGKSFLSTQMSVLWYIDGHETLSSRGCSIPDLFRSFQGYNLPEMSKHHKRTHTNLNCDQLASHAAALYDVLLLSWMGTRKWKAIRDATEALAKSLDV